MIEREVALVQDGAAIATRSAGITESSVASVAAAQSQVLQMQTGAGRDLEDAEPVRRNGAGDGRAIAVNRQVYVIRDQRQPVLIRVTAVVRDRQRVGAIR